MFDIQKNTLNAVLDAIIILLIIIDTVLLILITFYDLNPTTVFYIIYFDLAVCIVLFFEFIYRIRKVDDKRKFLRRNWPDILAMIPVDFISYNFVFLLRFIRIIRIIRLLRMFALFNKSLKLFFEFLKDTHLHISIGILIFTIFSGTIIFFLLESPVNAQIQNLWDSLWYVLPTIATIGSEDIVPLSPAGRLLSIFLMLTGLVLFSMVTASIASWYVELKETKARKESDKKMNELKHNIDGLHTEITDLKGSMAKTGFTRENIVYTPINIVSFIADLVSPWQSKKILDPACGSGSFFWMINKLNKNHPTYIGIDLGTDIIEKAEENLNKHNIDYELLNADFFKVKLEEKFDLIVSQPSFIQLKESLSVEGFNFLNNEFAYLFASLHLLEKDGHLIFILPEQKSFFYSDYNFPMREHLLKNYSVEGIISLPNDLFYPEATIKTCLLILKNSPQREKVFFAKYSQDTADILLKNFYENKSADNLLNGFWVNSTDLTDKNVSWNFNYFRSTKRLKYKKESSKYPIKSLEDIVTFKEDIGGLEDVILIPKNPMEDIIFKSELEDENLDNYIPCIISDEDIHPNYLKLYLNSDVMKNERNLYSTGTIHKTINKSGLKSLLIEIPDLKIQNLIIETSNLTDNKYDAMQNLYKSFKSDIFNYSDLLKFMKDD